MSCVGALNKPELVRFGHYEQLSVYMPCQEVRLHAPVHDKLEVTGSYVYCPKLISQAQMLDTNQISVLPTIFASSYYENNILVSFLPTICIWGT